jgi:hypothetical protein
MCKLGGSQSHRQHHECNKHNTEIKTEKRNVSYSSISFVRWFQGMLCASIFTATYIIAPLYSISAIMALLLRFPSSNVAFIYAVPLILSILMPSRPMPNVVGLLSPMLDYFQYEQIVEEEDTLKENLEKGKNYIFACQPHGVLSFCGICSSIKSDVQYRKMNSAVASSLLNFPILKNVMGIFTLIDASAKSLTKVLREKAGIEGSVVLYVGGIAEIFKTSRLEERLHLSQRKGFIKLALREGVDIVPVYLFGNTSILSVVSTSILNTVKQVRKCDFNRS